MQVFQVPDGPDFLKGMIELGLVAQHSEPATDDQKIAGFNPIGGASKFEQGGLPVSVSVPYIAYHLGVFRKKKVKVVFI